MYNTKNRNRCDTDEATTTLRTEDVGASLRLWLNYITVGEYPTKVEIDLLYTVPVPHDSGNFAKEL